LNDHTTASLWNHLTIKKKACIILPALPRQNLLGFCFVIGAIKIYPTSPLIRAKQVIVVFTDLRSGAEKAVK
jgi:hypothetical protein